MKILKIVLFAILMMPCFVFSQAIEIVSFSENPLEVNPLVGSNLTINYKYTSEAGSTDNHIYIGLELLDGGNTYQSTISEITLNNQSAGNNTQKSVSFFIGSIHLLSKDLPQGYYYQVKAILYKSGGWEEISVASYLNTPSLTLQDTSNYQFKQNCKRSRYWLDDRNGS
jgi:hypothetical protein